MSTDVVATFGFVVHLLAGIDCVFRLGAKCLLVNTPPKIVGLTALVNVVGDSLLCAWPLRLGRAGAAAATALATLTSCGAMLRVLSRREIMGLLEFTGPLLALTLTCMGGIIAMQRTATKLGIQLMARCQLCINVLMFFVLCSVW
jgi:peptidoglycan biosynthesis protein MviN/MurJ (putative lipid II flippase)